MSETAIVWTMIGTGVGITGILLTVLLTVMTMQGRAMHGRFDDQNRRVDDLRQHLDKRMDDQNATIQGRFDDQNQQFDEQNRRFDDQNRRVDDLRQHLDKRMDDQNATIQGRFDDQNQRIADLGGQTNRLAAEIGKLRTQLFGARNERQAATG